MATRLKGPLTITRTVRVSQELFLKDTFLKNILKQRLPLDAQKGHD